ncbi:MAG: sialidase family protein [candidate division WOR-3 bacterium]
MLLLTFYEVNLSNSPAFDGEPVVAVNPTNPNNVVVAWIKGMFGTSFIAVRSSYDGGITWSSVRIMPHVVGGFRSADPTMAFSEDGTLYLVYVDYSLDSGFVVLTVSTDGGSTWYSPRVIIRYDEAPDFPIDRPWLTVSGNNLYITTMEAKIAGATPPYYLYLKYSHDGGLTWSPLIPIGDSTNFPSQVRSMGQIALWGDSIIYIGYFSYNPSHYPLPRHMLAISTDGGFTFRYKEISALLPRSIVADTLLKIGSPLIVIPANGKIIATRIDGTFGDPDAVAQVSGDGGDTWTTPFRLNDDTPVNGVYQDMLWGCAKDSVVAFFWRDRRNGGMGRAVPFEIYGTISFDGGNTFGRNFVVSGQPSEYDTILTSSGNDFLSCALGDTAIYVAWGDLRDTSSHLDIYVAVMPIRKLGIKSKRYGKVYKDGAIYDVLGRRRSGARSSGVYFIVNENKAKKVIVK